MKLFQNNNARSKDLHIEFYEEEDTDYDVFIPWKKEFVGSNFFAWMRRRFSDFEEGEEQNDKNIFFFKNESTVAFRIHTEILNISPSILWNYWKDEIKEVGYVLKNSEAEYRGQKKTLRYYLKPRLKYKVEGEQLYGNITLELIKSEGKPEFIMLKCTWYNDQHFKKAEAFGNLYSQLMN